MNQKIFGLLHFLKRFWMLIVLELALVTYTFFKERNHIVPTAIYSNIVLWGILFLLLDGPWREKYYFYYNLGLGKIRLWVFVVAVAVFLTVFCLVVLSQFF
ncbi:MAG: hypothetical protein QM610_01005 [Chitinophagaceae bacterium]